MSENEHVIEPSPARTHEERKRDEADQPEGVAVIDPLRAPARDIHAEWMTDVTKTPGQLVAEGVDRKEATRRVRWARRQQKRMDEAMAVVEELNAKRLARKTAAERTPRLETDA